MTRDKPTRGMIETSAEMAENAVLPQRCDVHTDPDRDAPATGELPAALLKGDSRKSPAQWAYERVILYIRNFEETLDNDQEVGMGFTGGDAGVIRIEGLGYYDPDIVTFYGTDSTGAKTQLIQHVSQLNVMLRAAPKQVATAAPNRIGFRLAQALDNGDADAPGRDTKA